MIAFIFAVAGFAGFAVKHGIHQPTKTISSSACMLSSLTKLSNCPTPVGLHSFPRYRFSFLSASPRRELNGNSSSCRQLSTINSGSESDETKKGIDESDRLPKFFSMQLPQGYCVGLQYDEDLYASNEQLTPSAIEENSNHWIRSMLHPEEISFGLSQSSENSRLSFLLGRLSMRQALSHLQSIDSPKRVQESTCTINDCKLLDNLPAILKDEYGRPEIPHGFLGSISHKNSTAVALAIHNTTNAYDKTNQNRGQNPKFGIGIDIEGVRLKRQNIARRVLTKNEINELGQIEGITHDEEILLRFSIKESLYKAMHPLICQYVGFKEVEITPYKNSSASVTFNLTSKAHETFENVTIHWRKIDLNGTEFFLSSSNVTSKI